MPRATCRCGQVLTFPPDAPERVVCPVCGARIRVRRAAPPAPAAAGEPDAEGAYLRFQCTCGRRLKVRDTTPRPQAGKCPDCGQVVPVPEGLAATGGRAVNGASNDPESPTEEMTAEAAEAIRAWAARFRPEPAPTPVPGGEPDQTPPPSNLGTGSTASASGVTPSPARVEVGLRICPRCGRPVHLGAETCRHCGASVPKR